MTDPALLKAVEKMLTWQHVMEAANEKNMPMVITDELLINMGVLRALYSQATHDPCKLHRDGNPCRRCPYNPVCNE